MKTFIKPKGLKYTDMCIYIDKNAYTENPDDEKIFQYLYHLVSMLAHQGNYFRDEETYDEFSLRTAETYYTKIVRSRENKGEKVKSILNYLKSSLFSRKLRFIQNGFADRQTYEPISSEESFGCPLHYSMQSSLDEMAKVRFNSYLGDIPKTIKAYLNRLPYRNDRAFMNNFYVSVLLSIMNYVTTSYETQKQMIEGRMTEERTYQIVEKRMEEDERKNIILFQLGQEYEDYFIVIFRQVRALIANELSQMLHTYIPQNVAFSNMLYSETGEENEGQ